MTSRAWLGLPVLVLLSACSAAPSSTDSAQSSSAAMTMVCGASAGGPVQGRDVSVYQGSFDWAAEKSAGVVFGYARVSDGTGYVDSQFENNWTNMKAAGVLRGAYMFFEPGEDATTQANLMVSKVGMLGDGDLPAMIDVEVTGGQSGATIAAGVQTWMDVVEKGTGRHPIIYTGSYFWEDNVGSTAFGATPLWIAAYGPACPSVPNGWSNWLFWQYSDGGGSLDHDVFNGTLAELQALARPPDAPPHGYLDTVDCTQIGGWSQDADTPKQATNVDLYFDGPAGAPGAPGFRVLAGTDRADLCMPLGSCNHSFSVAPPASLLDNKPHKVFAYGIDTNSSAANAELTDSGKTFTCAPPALPKNVVKRWVTNPTSFQDWRFDAFRQVVHYDAEQYASVPKGADLPAKPKLVQAKGDPAIYVADGAGKRHVINPDSLAAWAFDGSMVTQVTPAEIAAMPSGPDWPAKPMLIQGTGPEVDMLDVAPPAPPSSGGGTGSPGGGGGANDNGGSGSSDQGGGCAIGGTGGSPAWMGLALGVLALLRRRR